MITGVVGAKGRARGVGGWKSSPASPGLAVRGELELEVEDLSWTPGKIFWGLVYSHLSKGTGCGLLG